MYIKYPEHVCYGGTAEMCPEVPPIVGGLQAEIYSEVGGVT